MARELAGMCLAEVMLIMPWHAGLSPLQSV